MDQAIKGYSTKKRMVDGCKILFGQSCLMVDGIAYRPSSLLGDDHYGRIVEMIGMSDRVVMKLELGLIPYISCCCEPERYALPSIANPQVKQIFGSERRHKILSYFTSAHASSIHQCLLRGDIIWDHTTICVRHLEYILVVWYVWCAQATDNNPTFYVEVGSFSEI